jgi:hypothetical protein
VRQESIFQCYLEKICAEEGYGLFGKLPIRILMWEPNTGGKFEMEKI